MIEEVDRLRKELADARAELEANHAALLKEPSLRTCLVPGCLHQFDMISHMTGAEPPRPEWSGKGWAQLGMGSIFPAGGNICPDHKDLVTAHMPRRAQLLSGRWTVDCACEWTAVPQTWHGVLSAMWEQHILTVTGVLPDAPPVTDPEHRAPLSELTEADLAGLYDRLWDAESNAHDTMDAGRAAFRAWDHARRTLDGGRLALEQVCQRMATDSRDWTANKRDAWLYGVLVGHSCEDQHEHDDICGGDTSLDAVAAQYGWRPFQVQLLRQHRGWIAAIAPKHEPPATAERRD